MVQFYEIKDLSQKCSARKDFIIKIGVSVARPSLPQKIRLVGGGGVGLFFVKLHSEFALPTELQLDRVGVDFVFPPSQWITTTFTKIYQK